MERHDTIQPLLTDYILGELSTADRRRVDAHVTECAACAAELRELTLAFQSIGLQEEPVAPPPHLRARVLDGIAQQAGTAAPLATRTRRMIPAAWLAAAAASVVALGAALGLVMQRSARLDGALQLAGRENRLLTANLEAARTDAEQLARRIATTEAQADLVVAILTATDMRRIELTGYEGARGSVARGYFSATHGLVIVADRLPAPPAGRIYQVWLIGSSSGTPVSAGLIDAPRSGRGMLIVPAVPGVGGTVTIAVTDEPPGGLAAPTGAKYFLGS